MTRKQNPDTEQKSKVQASASSGQKSASGKPDTPRQQGQQARNDDATGRRQQNAANPDARPSHSGYEEDQGTGRGKSAGSRDPSQRSGSQENKPAVRNPGSRDRDD
jgi:hypothetical protein